MNTEPPDDGEVAIWTPESTLPHTVNLPQQDNSFPTSVRLLR